MNRIYKLVWNASRGALVPVAETTAGRGKRGGRAGIVASAISTALLALAAGRAEAIPSPCGLPITSDTTLSSSVSLPSSVSCNPGNNASLTVDPDVVIAATDGAAIVVQTGSTAGAITNNGTIMGATRGIVVEAAGTLSGGLQNNGLIQGAAIAVEIGSSGGPLAVVGDIVNNAGGTITSTAGFTAFQADFANIESFTNSGLIDSMTDVGAAIYSSTVNGDILNAGQIDANFIALRFINDTVQGSISNTGTLNGGLEVITTAQSGDIVNDGAIDVNSYVGIGVYLGSVDDVINNGQVSVRGGGTGMMVYGNEVRGSILNTGTLLADGAGVVITFSTAGSFNNTGTIHGDSVGVLMHENSISGGITNSGTISSLGNALELGDGGLTSLSSSQYEALSATISGGILNSGVIESELADAVRFTGSTVSDGIFNDGTISALAGAGIRLQAGLEGDTSTPSLIRSTLDGSLVNSGVISGHEGIDLRQTDVSGAIFNATDGAIVGESFALALREGSNLAGGVTNSGTIWSEAGAAFVIDNATVASGLVNAGIIASIDFSSSTLPGPGVSIVNGSVLSGGIVNFGLIAGSNGILLDSSSTLTGRIVNSGLIGSYDLSLNLLNASDPFAIDNSGTLFGDADIGINTLNLDGNGAQVLGNVRGAGATVNVNGDFISEGSFDVNAFNITTDGVLHLAHTISVGEGGFSNDGVLEGASGATATINGNYTQTADALYRLTLADGASDYGRLAVSGDVTLAAGTGIDVNVIGSPVLANNARVSDIIKADGTLTRDAINVTDNSFLFNFTADTTRDAGAVDLIVVSAASPDPTPDSTPDPIPDPIPDPTPDPTSNPTPEPTPDPTLPPPPPPSGWGQTVLSAARDSGNLPGLGAARALDGLIATSGGTSDMQQVITALGTLATAGQVSSAVRQTLPLITGAGAMAANNALHSMNRIIQARLESNRSLSCGDETSSEEHLWIRPFSSRAKQDDRDGVTGFESRTYGVALGLDGAVNDDWRVGSVLTYADSNVDNNSGPARQRTDVKTYELVGYASYTLDAYTDINYQLDVGYNTHQGSRSISFGGLDRTAASDYGSFAAHLGAGIGRVVPLSARINVTPSVRADYTRVATDEYTETGAGALNLRVGSETFEEFLLSTDLKLGLQLSQTLKLISNVTVAYDTLSSTVQATSAFVGGGSAFTTNGLEPSPWLGRFGLGLLSVNDRNGMEWQFRYDAEKRDSGYLNQTLSARLRKRF